MSSSSEIASPVGGQPPSNAHVDTVLTAQILVAWAGETAEDPRRLGWWRSDLVSEFGGQDLFRRLMPQTWQWAVLQAVREAATRVDRAARRRHHDPDSIRSLFHLGFELDELVGERLLDLKRSGQTPEQALPDLALVAKGWSRDRFEAWVRQQGDVKTTAEPIGRRVRLPPESGDSLEATARLLVAALIPLSDTYPLPHLATGR